MEIDEERKKRVINKLNWVIEIFNSKIDAKKMSYYCPNDGEI